MNGHISELSSCLSITGFMVCQNRQFGFLVATATVQHESYGEKQVITKTRLFKYIENLTTPKNGSVQIKILIFFHISAQNIDCGYSLEPPRRGGSYEYPQSMF